MNDSYSEFVDDALDGALIEAVESILRQGVYAMDLRRRVDEIIENEANE
jgi:hypothetical protein